MRRLSKRLSAGVLAVGVGIAAVVAAPVPQLSPTRPVRLYVLDLGGDGIALTSAPDGVAFDLDDAGRTVQTAWTKAGSDDSFVVVDAAAKRVTRGSQLLGTGMRTPDGRRILPPDRVIMALQGIELNDQWRAVTPLTQSPALEPDDPVFRTLRIWTDRNHNGQSEPDELRSFSEAGIASLPGSFRPAQAPDANGNIVGPIGPFAISVRGVEVWREMHIVQFARK